MNQLISFMAGNVSSQDGAGQSGGGFLGGGGSMLLIFAIFFAVLYFFSIRPQKKRERKQKEKLSSIGKGDRVQTIGGWRGTVVSVKETTFILKLEDGARIEIVKSAVADVVSAASGRSSGKESDEPKGNRADRGGDVTAIEADDESAGQALPPEEGETAKSDSVLPSQGSADLSQEEKS